jgi:Sensors of blue-light using FAD
MEKLIQVIYVSSAVADISEHDTVQYVNAARTANRKHDVSGMMIYVGGCFLQLLEGEPTQVEAVCEHMSGDKRDMRMILREPIAERQFPEWTMGFEAVEPLEAGQLLGEPALFASVSNLIHIDYDNAKTLLSIIGRRRWQSDRSGMFRAIRHAS